MNEPISVSDLLASFSSDIGVPPSFLNDLLSHDDWTFLIKGHAFLEAALTQLLTAHSQTPALLGFFSHLEMSARPVGTVAFAEATGLLDVHAVRFLRKFSELRNLVVHNVSNVSFHLDAWYSGLDRQQRQSFHDAISYVAAAAPVLIDASTLRSYGEGFAAASPKLALWVNLSMLGSVLARRHHAAKVVSSLGGPTPAAVLEFLRTRSTSV